MSRSTTSSTDIPAPLGIAAVEVTGDTTGADATAPPIEADATLNVGTDCPPIPAGTPVIAEGGQVGEVLSHDGITGQVQIAFERGGRGWYSPKAVKVNVTRDS
jgi:hypothetical protein